MGSIVAGKQRRMLSFAGGVGTYHQKCEELAIRGYPGFAMSSTSPSQPGVRQEQARWRQNVIENPYYSQEGHGPYELHDSGDLSLEVGGTIRGCRLAVATHGRLNGAKDNAILVPTWCWSTEFYKKGRPAALAVTIR
jgi:hypothetical protein